MSAQSLLEQLIKSGIGMLDGKQSRLGGAASPATDWKPYVQGGAVGGALGLLLGSKRGRKMGGKALKYGGVAALGYAAFKVYQRWQAQQTAGQAQEPAAHAGPLAAGTAQGTAVLAAPASLDSPWRLDREGTPSLPATEMERHSRAMLKAMIAAAKSDGHVNEQEQRLIDAELQRQELDSHDRTWLQQELRRPTNPTEVAALASTQEQAAEIYLASLLVVDEASFMERAYLDELARQLRLPEGLKRELEAQALSA